VGKNLVYVAVNTRYVAITTIENKSSTCMKSCSLRAAYNKIPAYSTAK